MQFKRLEIHGFKSFAERHQIEFYDGLTGIVGPNGCGKSNIVEAIRWVMGEKSARKMRSSEMDDVIFSGTAERAKRNLAQVTLVLDNQELNAPEKYNHHDELQITRKIERNEGSTYLINGQEVRASDVQLLFADLSLGAGGSAQISQGMVSELIQQRPTERRKLLEEAAGIRGLRVRREAAERKLSKTEDNLVRIDDIINVLTNQQKDLTAAVKKTRKYKEISLEISQLKAQRHYKDYQGQLQLLSKHEAQLGKANIDVAQGEAEQIKLQQEITVKKEILEKLQQEFYGKQASHKRYEIELENFDKTSQARQTEFNRMTARQQEISQQQTNYQSQSQNATDTQAKLQEQIEALSADKTQPMSALEPQQQEYKTLQSQRDSVKNTLQAMQQERAEAQGVKQALEKETVDMQARLQQLNTQITETQQALTVLQGKKQEYQPQQANSQLTMQQEAVRQAEQKTTQLFEKTLPQAEQNQQTAKQNLANIDVQMQQIIQPMQEKHTQISAEIDTLSRVFQKQNQDFTSMVDKLTVAEGFELAVAAVFADDLEASLEQNAPIFWLTTHLADDVANLPEGVRSLAEFVKGPPQLALRLSQIGIIFDAAEADAITQQLKQGQRLVSKDGAVWRWDGFRITAGAVAPAAKRLEERNRLAALVTERGEIEEKLTLERRNFSDKQQTSKDELLQAEQQQQLHGQEYHQAMQILQQAQKDLHQSERSIEQQQQSYAQLDARILEATEKLQELTLQEKAVTAGIADLQIRIERLGAKAETTEKINLASKNLEELEIKLREKYTMIEQLKTADNLRTQRLTDLQDRQKEWAGHAENAQSNLSRLLQEAKIIQQQIEEAHLTPEKAQAERQKILSLIQQAQDDNRGLQKKLEASQEESRGLEQQMTKIRDKIKKAEEIKIRSDESQKIHAEQLKNMMLLIQEEFGEHPDKLPLLGGFDDANKLPTLDVLTERLRYKTNEREAMGEVNLMAETQSEELTSKLQEITEQQEDLQEAVKELQHGIQHLNQEARKNLLVAYTEVNRHFSDIFVKLFGGGKAMIKLDNEEDALNAGLEIFASPPGKKLHHLGLLSGGEQALTALSLVMAIFMTKPMPICILDEVDAPLDDENVRRLYDLIEELSTICKTRFLLVTHHRMGMSRCKYLYGVTMAEKGVSRLVSVDLGKAAA